MKTWLSQFRSRLQAGTKAESHVEAKGLPAEPARLPRSEGSKPRSGASPIAVSVLLVLLLAMGGVVSAQEAAWTQLNPAVAPPPRLAADALAYDSGSDRMVLFGGFTNERTFHGDTWTFDLGEGSWTNMNPSLAPPARSDAALAYDAQSDRIVLFGGVRTGFVDINDTWAYDLDANAWEDQGPADAPSPRIGHRMVYHPESDRIILVGGLTGSIAAGNAFGDTWAYDYDTNTWTELAPLPESKTADFHGMAYDAESDRVVMYGGGTSTAGETWAYHYATDTWTNMNPASSPPRGRGYAVGYDSESDRIILFGGNPSQTWAYDFNANSWSDLDPSPAPSGSFFPGLAYHEPSDRIVTFGGCLGFESNCHDETWSFDYNAILRSAPLDFWLIGIVVGVAAAVAVVAFLIWRGRRRRTDGET